MPTGSTMATPPATSTMSTSTSEYLARVASYQDESCHVLTTDADVSETENPIGLGAGGTT